ncbi:MAG: hypothetical protein QGD92_04975 [Gammaproteobacteria bacterium]|nr:hypothetical protein [Gammaproteobacteria bacterium]
MAKTRKPSAIEYYTGFDGGGTYTRVLVEDNQGREVFRARGDSPIRMSVAYQEYVIENRSS